MGPFFGPLKKFKNQKQLKNIKINNKSQRRQPTKFLVDGYQNHHRSPESPQGENLAGFFVSVIFRDEPPECGDNWYTFRYTL